MNLEHSRPDPDELLDRIKEEEKVKDRKKGYLKIFLGYVAGVGKTYRMLSEARILNSDGQDIVVGLAETHGRVETEELLKGLEILPKKQIEYGGILIDELDVDVILDRKPKYVMIDELAHTNVPGSLHSKRYHDVEEILDAGINVYTTLNVQHIESLKDIIYQITGVEVRETVPDRIIERADKIEIVDLPTEELLQRLEEGKVYIPEKVQQAVLKFFKERNLVALREVGLRYATRVVDSNMKQRLEMEGVLGPWDASSKIMVCVNSRKSSENMVRLAHRYANTFNSEWLAVYVEPSYKFKMGYEESLQLENNLKLAEELGGKVFRLTGIDIAEEIVLFAKSKNISLIVIGHSERSRIEAWIRGSVVNEIIRKGSPIQVLVIEGGEGPNNIDHVQNVDGQDYFDIKSYFKPFTVSLLSIVVISLVCLFLRPYLEAINIPMIFIIPIVLSGLISGRKGGIIASVMAVAFFDFFFVPPFYTFSVDDIRFIPTFIVLFIVGIITSFLADTVKKQVQNTRQREEFIASLYDFSRDLLISQNLDDFLNRITSYIEDLFNYDVVMILSDNNNNHLKIASRKGNNVIFDDRDLGLANWAYEHEKSAGYGTDTLSSSKWYYLPLSAHKSKLGVLAVSPYKSDITNEQKHLLKAYTSIVSIALENYLKK
jgi:two-component system, OmpR family, sensor histidine kinase KdpD